MNHYRIAAIPGDGIGKEIVPEGMRVLNDLCALSTKPQVPNGVNSTCGKKSF